MCVGVMAGGHRQPKPHSWESVQYFLDGKHWAFAQNTAAQPSCKILVVI